jgi:NAD(P)-dependent dehydrogenase (short-subunit alcohol dehydrogenase family)
VAVKDLSGRRCLITGAASGIGRATALAVAGKGAHLFLTDINGEGLEATAAEIRQAGGTVDHLRAADVSDHAAVAALAAEIHASHGSMDVVMNIAGVSTWGSIERLRHSDWQRMIDVNLMGPIHVLECFVPPMIEAGRGGHVVNVSSAAGLIGLPWHAAYSASKFGLRGISEVLRFDLRRHGIGVSLVCPGGVRTPLVQTVEIVGVDRNSPRMQKLTASFERRAVSPEHVAAKIIEGIEKNRYMVLTSRDIRIAYWFQRKFAPPYELAMRRLNDRLTSFAERD